MSALKKVLSILLRLVISAALLTFLFRQIDKGILFGIIKNIDKPVLFCAFFVSFFSYLLCFFRWEMLLNAVHAKISSKRIITSYAGGVFFNLFLPSTIGGDLVRSVDMAAHTKKSREVVATVILDRLSGYIGLVAVTLLALALGWGIIKNTSVLFSIAIITAILICVLLVLFNKVIYSKINKLLHSYHAVKILQYIKDVHEEIHIFRHHKAVIVNNLLISAVLQAITPVTFYLIALSLGIKINILYFFIFLPIISAITLLPISIGGLGLREATTIFFFTQVGLTKDLSFAMSIVNFFFMAVYASLGGLIYVLTVHHRRV
jgi:uncharacterized protein (TIRG00374 family)